ncbi:amidase family protein [Delftia deserti]|uniref:Amidase family protein n=1 Tax=Delftia deserti TaxID=1651218 RepID=A0ABW5EXI4_9BURK
MIGPIWGSRSGWRRLRGKALAESRPLHGIPLAVKNAIDTAGTRTTAGSAQYESRIPAEDAHLGIFSGR